MLELLKRGHTAFGSGSRDMKIFVTGVGGQLGHDVVNDAVGRGHEAMGLIFAANIVAFKTDRQLSVHRMYSLT